MKYEKLILDTDICIKIGNYEKVKFIEMIIPKIAEKAYMHRYVYEDELLTPKNAKVQIDNLIRDNIIEILDEDMLDILNRKIYEDTKKILKKYMIGTEERGKNWGEVVSLSMAKTLNIPYFASDEENIQPIIDKHLNVGTEYDIEVVRVEHIVKWIKENKDCEIGRKTAKALWRSSGKENEFFDKYIWKL
ncbi:hypothetical protein [Clostridium tagluense]|uniref:hypothetical protein n=1 Tax=Clostridium tagluense TaxID=360422 RepID=UPI001CF5F10D|nr:hypothetical protein [Clostridium tagluense]MCB2300260.1 hypothetical protein [Clostridium tagluense]